MAGSKIRAIIFDIGRVLVGVDPNGANAGLAQGLSLTPAEMWTALEKDPRWRDWQEGRVSPREWHLGLCKRFGVSLDFDQFTTLWNSTLVPDPILPIHLFERLSQSYRLALLSNTDPIHVAKLECSYEFFRYFPKDHRIYSCSVGCSKPDPVIFQRALRACKVRAPEAVYVDDLLANVEAAKRLGMTGIHFRSEGQFQRELAAALG